MVEPILVSVAAALAAKSAAALYDLVKRRFAGRQEAEAALDAADGAPPDSPEVAALADRLATEVAEDPAFGKELRRTWQQVSSGAGSMANQIIGNPTRTVQARDVEGGISF